MSLSRIVPASYLQTMFFSWNPIFATQSRRPIMTPYKKLKTVIAVSLLFSICSFSSAQRFPHRAGTAKNNVQSGVANASVFATDLRFPRGLKFGPDSRLYVAESGLGGEDNTIGLCDQDPNFGPFQSGRTSRVRLRNPSAWTTTSSSMRTPPNAASASTSFQSTSRA